MTVSPAVPVSSLALDHPICRTCAVQYEPDVDRGHCRICEDERQYVGADGQQWTSLRQLADEGYRVDVHEEAPGLWGVGTTPHLGIGQRGLLIPGDGGNVLWDCTTMMDDAGLAAVAEQGGIAAIALSHPHYNSSMTDWSRAFGDVPIFVHARDREWLGRADNVELWTGHQVEVLPGRTMVNVGVHFAGGSVLHWRGTDGRGALATGDIFNVVADRRWVSFMYSYPNLIPEHPDTIRRALELVAPFDYNTVYSAWWGTVLRDDAKAAVMRSAHRYLTHLGLSTDGLPDLA